VRFGRFSAKALVLVAVSHTLITVRVAPILDVGKAGFPITDRNVSGIQEKIMKKFAK
jgi:hypothetical protein